MKRNHDIWLGDLIRSWEIFAPANDATSKLLAGLLGFTWTAEIPDKKKPVPPDSETETLTTSEVIQPPPPPPAAPPLPVQEPEPDPLATELPQLESQQKEQMWKTEWASVQLLPPPVSNIKPYPVIVPPLFRPGWSRTIVTTMASRRLPIGSIDEERLVRTMASAQPVRTIPRRPRWSTSLGLQLLIDKGPGMAPFVTDQIAIARQFNECVGGERLEKCRFCNSPLRGLSIAGSLVEYRPPQPGVPVVAVSDLGLGAPDTHINSSRPDEWLALARLLAARDSALAVLVPWPRERIPSRLRRSLAIVEWDRLTSATRARRLLEQVYG
ncbi:MAG: hypothetical protein GY799_14500 [Desulfobulbaceae bacterium]|nr:hypothetical protein [Desulfobulbaceae bacterium]